MPLPDAPSILTALWHASWQAGLLAVLVLALRLTLGDRLSAAWRTRLWGLVLLRLALPAVPACPVSPLNLLPADPVPAAVWPTVTAVVRVPPPPTVTADAAPPPAVIAAAVRPSPVPPALVAAWLAGAAAMATATGVAHVRFAGRVRRSRRPVPTDVGALWRDTAAAARVRPPPLVVTDAVSSPALFGVARGRLLLPPDLWDRLSAAELRMVFRHELAHVRRRDLAAGWAAVGVRCLYWFHPLVWAATAARQADAEAACDDAALAGAGPADRLTYGRALLAVAGGRRLPLARATLGMADARTDLRRRLARVSAGRRSGWRSAAAAGLLTAVVGCAALTGSDRPANVTRTYPNFWPDYGVTPQLVSGASRQTTPTASDPSLATVIRRSVTPDIWGHHGVDVHAEGTVAVVTAPPDTQAAVERMIAEQSAQVSIETRVLTLRPSQVRAAGLTLPDVGVVGPVPSDGVDALIRADQTATQLTAPRLTVFNGQRAAVTVETQQAYVSNLTPVVAPGAALFDPTVSTVPAVRIAEQVGVTLPADHQSIALTAHVEVGRLLSLEPFTVSAVTANDRGSQTIQGTLQIPQEWSMTVDASVRLPSGGCCLMRGQPVRTYRTANRPPAPLPAAATDDDAAETVVIWKATVLSDRPLVGLPRPPAPAAAPPPALRPATPAAATSPVHRNPITGTEITPRPR